jgi:hypothetical protein
VWSWEWKEQRVLMRCGVNSYRFGSQGRHTCRPNPIHCDSKKERTLAVVLINSHEGGSPEPTTENRPFPRARLVATFTTIKRYGCPLIHDFGFRSLFLGHRTSPVGLRISLAGPRTLDSGYRDLYLGLRTLYSAYRSSSLGYRDPYLGLRTLSAGLRRSSGRHRGVQKRCDGVSKRAQCFETCAWLLETVRYTLERVAWCF